MRKVLLSALMVGVVTTGAMAGSPYTNPADDTFKVTAEVYAGCVIDSTSDISVVYDPLDSNDKQVTQTAAQFKCVKNTVYTISVTGTALQNSQYGGTYGMTSTTTGDTLEYNISYTPANGTATSNALQDLQVTITIPGGQDVGGPASSTDPAVVYEDDVTVTINW